MLIEFAVFEAPFPKGHLGSNLPANLLGDPLRTYCDLGRDFTEFSAFRMTFLPVQLLSGAEQGRGHLVPCTVVKAEGTLQVNGAVSRKRDSLDSKTNERMRGSAGRGRAVVGIHHHTNLFEKGRR